MTKWPENCVKICLWVTILRLESLLKPMFAISRMNCFSMIICVIILWWFLNLSTFARLDRFFKTLNTRTWRCKQFYYWVLLTLIHWNTFRLKVKEDIRTNGKACVTYLQFASKCKYIQSNAQCIPPWCLLFVIILSAIKNKETK